MKEGNILFNDAVNTFLFTVIWHFTRKYHTDFVNQNFKEQFLKNILSDLVFSGFTLPIAKLYISKFLYKVAT